MAGESIMKIIVSADVRDAITGLKSTGDAVENTAKKFPVLGSAILDAKEKIETITARIYLLDKAAINSKVGENLASQLRIAKQELTTLEKQAGLTGDKVGNAFTGAYSKLRILANILPGIGIAGLIGLASNAVVDFFSSSTKEAQKATEANKAFFAAFGKTATENLSVTEIKKAVDDYNKIVTQSIETTAKESTQVDILVSRLKSGNASRSETVAIIGKLQQIAPDYFGKLDKEKASIDDITKAYGAYNSALVSNIEAQIKIAEITDIVKKRLSFAEINPDADKFVNNLRAQGKSLADISIISQKAYSESQRALNQLAQSGKPITDELLKQTTLQSKIPFGVSTLINYLQDEEAILKKINNVPLKDLNIKTSGGIDVGKAELAQLQEILRLQTEIAKPSREPLFKQQELSVNTSEVELIQHRISEAIEQGNKIGTDNSRRYAALLADLYNQELKKVQFPDLHTHIAPDLAEVGPDVDKAIKKFYDDTGKTLDERVRKLQPITTDIKIRPLITLDAKLLAKQVADINKAITDAIQGGLGSLGESIGNAIGSGANVLEAAGKSILSTFGDLISNIGKALIEYGVIKEGLDKIFEGGFAIPGVAAIALGVAAIALGSLIKSVGSSYKAMAEGGVVTGPQLALIGEAGPEVVFPLDKLNQFIKNKDTSTNVNVGGQLKIQGTDLVIILNRANKNRGLI